MTDYAGQSGLEADGFRPAWPARQPQRRRCQPRKRPTTRREQHTDGLREWAAHLAPIRICWSSTSSTNSPNKNPGKTADKK